MIEKRIMWHSRAFLLSAEAGEDDESSFGFGMWSLTSLANLTEGLPVTNEFEREHCWRFLLACNLIEAQKTDMSLPIKLLRDLSVAQLEIDPCAQNVPGV